MYTSQANLAPASKQHQYGWKRPKKDKLLLNLIFSWFKQWDIQEKLKIDMTAQNNYQHWPKTGVIVRKAQAKMRKGLCKPKTINAYKD